MGGPLSSGGITCTTSRSTTGLRRGTRTSLSTSRPASETPPLVILSPWENAAIEQDREVQHLEGVQVCPLQEGLLRILSARCCTDNVNKSWPLNILQFCL